MSYSNDSAIMTMPVAPTGYAGGNGMFGEGGWWFIIILAILFGGFGGWGNGGYGASNNAGSAVLATDFATIERKIDGVNSGLCDGFYAQNSNLLNGFAGVNQNLSNGFANLNTNLCQLGASVASGQNATQMAIMQGQNALQSQLAGCCCDIREGIQANTTQGVMNTNAIQQQIASCCCENEKMQLQGRYDAAQAHCATLTAIDKVGDRIIDYLTHEKSQALRDENQALRLAASQQAQNAYLVNQLRPPFPIPAYTVANPFAPVTAATA